MTTVQPNPAESREIPTLVVPDDIYDEALTFCNARLREQGEPEITELPAGKRMDAWSCPCGAACGVRVEGDEWAEPIDDFEEGFDWNNGGPARFVEFFDTFAGKELTLPIRASLAGGAS